VGLSEKSFIHEFHELLYSYITDNQNIAVLYFVKICANSGLFRRFHFFCQIASFFSKNALYIKTSLSLQRTLLQIVGYNRLNA
jgi:hypothetical protein